MSDNEPTCGWGVNDSIDIYNGNLSGIKIFDHALTAEEILAIYNPPKPWYKRLWRWLKKTFRRTPKRKLTLEETILSTHPVCYWTCKKDTHDLINLSWHDGEWHEYKAPIKSVQSINPISYEQNREDIGENG